MKPDPTKSSGTPPPVSSGEWSKRLTVDIDRGNSFALGTAFDLTQSLEDNGCISELVKRVSALCSVIQIFHEKIFTPDTTSSVSFLSNYCENVNYLYTSISAGVNK